MQKCVFLPYTPFEIFAREYMEYFHKDKFNCKKNKNCPIVANVQYSWQHTLINAEHLKSSAFNAEVLLGVVNHGLMVSFITLTCTDGQQLNKQYDHNYFQVDVPDSIGVSKIYLSMYVWFVTLFI